MKTTLLHYTQNREQFMTTNFFVSSYIDASISLLIYRRH